MTPEPYHERPNLECYEFAHFASRTRRSGAAPESAVPHLVPKRLFLHVLWTPFGSNSLMSQPPFSMEVLSRIRPGRHDEAHGSLLPLRPQPRPEGTTSLQPSPDPPARIGLSTWRMAGLVPDPPKSLVLESVRTSSVQRPLRGPWVISQTSSGMPLMPTTLGGGVALDEGRPSRGGTAASSGSKSPETGGQMFARLVA